MYTSNAKTIQKNLVRVEMTGLLSNIEYGVHFGKSMETYYGMRDLLCAELQLSELVDDLYVVNGKGEVLFQTGEAVPEQEVLRMQADSCLRKQNSFYCSFLITKDVRLLTKGDISGKIREWRNYYVHLLRIAFAGFLISWAVMFGIGRLPVLRSAVYNCEMGILLLWAVLFSGFIGYRTYGEYSKSIEQVCTSISRVVAADFSRIREQGIADENITGIPEYLKRFSDNVPEIKEVSVKKDGSGCDFVLSEETLGKKSIDYVLQTLLFLAFSVMILAETHLYLTRRGT
jgi:hypothetical protein